MKMTELEFQDCLQDLLDEHGGETRLRGPAAVQSVRSFEDRGILTDNKGLVIKMDDGTEFQVTIVRSG